MTDQALTLLAVLLLTHYLGDFTHLSTPRMLEAKATGRSISWIGAHAGVHAVLGLAVGLVARPTGGILLAAFVLELVTHFLIDTGRAKLCASFPSCATTDNDAYWYLLGVDQLLHGWVLLAIVAMVL